MLKYALNIHETLNRSRNKIWFGSFSISRNEIDVDMTFYQISGNLLVDRRWVGNTGIGRYSREMIPQISFLIDGYLDGGNPISLMQMGASSVKGLQFAKFYSPGYVPLMGIKRQCITIHDLILLDPAIGNRAKFLFFNQLVLPRIKHGMLKVITVSRSSQKEIAEWANISKEQIAIVPNGLSSQILEAGRSMPDFRHKRSLVFVGNMKKHKNFSLFTDAVNLLPGSWKITLVGPQLSVAHIENRHEVKSCWNISDRELASIYANSSILVNTSSLEGFGMSFLEGGYLGCKVIHLGVLPSVQEILGEDSFHTDGSYSPRDLADLISYVSEETTQPNVREFLTAEYSWKNSGKILAKILSDL